MACSVDSANDLVAVDGLTPEPLHQASNKSPLAQPTPLVKQLGAARAKIVLNSRDGSIGFLFGSADTSTADVLIDQSGGDLARLAVGLLPPFPFSARQTLEQRAKWNRELLEDRQDCFHANDADRALLGEPAQ